MEVAAPVPGGGPARPGGAAPTGPAKQVEIYFSIVQRKVLTPNDFTDLAEVERRLLAFERRYEEAARPFEWKFTKSELARLMKRLAERTPLLPAA